MPHGAWQQFCCSHSPCHCSRPLLTCTSAGDNQTIKGSSGSVSLGCLCLGVHKTLFEPSKHFWLVWSLILTAISPLLLSCLSFSFVLGPGVSSFRGNPTFSCHWLFKSQFQFWSLLRKRWVHILLLHHLTIKIQSMEFFRPEYWSG